MKRVRNYNKMKQVRRKREQGTDFMIFKRWKRKTYSLFITLRREIIISILPVTYFLSVPILSFAIEQDTSEIRYKYGIEEVKVTARAGGDYTSRMSRIISVIDSKDIEQAPVKSVQDLLKYVVSIDVRQRGAEGIQADLCFRGGSFDQTLILLNGINISDPQTGHHNMDIPVGLDQIERIEVLTSAGARVYGPDAFTGAVNIVTKQPDGNRGSVGIDAGSFGYFNTGLTGNFGAGRLSNMLAGNIKGSKGYTDNTDFRVFNLFYKNSFQSETGNLTSQLGISGKAFGANSFYSPKYPNQYEQTKTSFMSARWQSDRQLHFSPVIYMRRHFDKFMLFRDNAPDWYQGHNYHRTDVYGINLNSWFLWKGGKTSFGAGFRSENILSNILGTPIEERIKVKGEDEYYTHSKSRATLSAFFEHIYYLYDWTFCMGGIVNYISDNNEDLSFFPGFEAGYRLSGVLKFEVSWNTSLRMPTFTDLYYSSPTNTGNPDLLPERSTTLEGGIKLNSNFFKGHFNVFFREGNNMIDWVKKPGDELWQSKNLTQINSAGTEIQLGFNLEEYFKGLYPDRLLLSYLYNKQKKYEGEYISYYILDNLKHKFIVSANQRIAENISFDFRGYFQDREGTFTRYTDNIEGEETPYMPFWLFDGKILIQKENIMIYISVNNIFDKSYFDIGDVVQPGRLIKTGILYKFVY